MKTLLLLLFGFAVQISVAQQTEIKDHSPNPYIGNAKLLTSWGQYAGKACEKVFRVDIPNTGLYRLTFWATLVAGAQKLDLALNGAYTGHSFNGAGIGWEKFVVDLRLNMGINELVFSLYGNMVPLAENLQLEWIGVDKTAPVKQPAKPLPITDNTETSRTLPNPAGNYEHDIETPFSYTTCAWFYLEKNVRYIFTTANTNNADPVLHLFHPANTATMSWTNDNATTATRESRIDVVPAINGFYQLWVRGTKTILPGTHTYTKIFCNNVLMVERGRIGGTVLTKGIGGTPDKLNFFTCRLNNPNADTRMMLINGQNLTTTFYNDDYAAAGGDWYWGFSSRINKAWPAGLKPYITFVSAYSPFSEGIADTYIGNRNSVTWTNFTNWKEDDCIQAGVGYPLAYNPFNYNCIAWAGGLTNAFYWPGQYFSTWTVYGNDLASFDNYFSNTPARYPGAYTYTRTGATWDNAVVDLWATTNGGTGIYYTHGSVQKPGNNQPHGYDWESKPGSTERSFHPRTGPGGETGANYGLPVNHYIHTGTFARTASTTTAFGTAEEAVQAGLAVYDNPQLSEKAQLRLQVWKEKTNTEKKNLFAQLYKNWKATWAGNAVQSNPAAYCRNKEYKQLEEWCRQNNNEALPLLCSQYAEGDFLAENLLCAVALPQYKYLLEEVKTEYKNNLYNKEGKFRIRSDFGNGICFIEKILSVTAAEIPAANSLPVTVTASPNPASNWFTVKLNISETARVGVKAISAQTRATKILLAEKELSAGNYNFTVNTTGFAGGNGDIITVQVNINGELKTYKVLVTK